MSPQVETTPAATRLGLSVVSYRPLPIDVARIVWAEEAGFDEVWTAEMPGTDPFVLSALGLRETSRIRIGIGVASIGARSATTTAISSQSVADIGPDRFVLGLGTSSPQINEQWHGVTLGSGLAALGRYTRQVGTLLSGATHRDDGLKVRLPKSTARPVPIYLGVLGPRMLALASEVADGVVGVFGGPRWVRWMRSVTARPEESGNLGLAIRVFVPTPGDDPEALEQVRQLIARYSQVPAYAAHFARLATLAPPDESESDNLIAEIVPHGPLETQVAWLRGLAAAGCDSIALEPVTGAGLASDGSPEGQRSIVEPYLSRLVAEWKTDAVRPGQRDA